MTLELGTRTRITRNTRVLYSILVLEILENTRVSYSKLGLEIEFQSCYKTKKVFFFTFISYSIIIFLYVYKKEHVISLHEYITIFMKIVN